jgi:serine protease
VDAYAAVLAAGGAASGPRLGLSPASLDFGEALTTLDVQVTNTGTDRLTLGAVSASTRAGGDWLRAAAFGAGDATRGADGIRVEVSRAGLANGVYRGTVTVASDGGDRTIDVAMRVGPPGTWPAAPVDVYVQLVDAATDETIEELVLPAGSEPAFLFEGLAPGTYYVFAGSDVDDDGWLCDAEDWCGSSGSVEVAAGQAIEDVVLAMAPPATGVGTRAERRRAGGVRR